MYKGPYNELSMKHTQLNTTTVYSTLCLSVNIKVRQDCVNRTQILFYCMQFYSKWLFTIHQTCFVLFVNTRKQTNDSWKYIIGIQLLIGLTC